MRAGVITSVLLMLLAGCQGGAATGQAATSTAFPAGSSEHTLDAGGRERTYRVHRPAELPEPAPLVVVLHGGFGSGKQAERAYGWNALADQEHFVVAYPDGLDRAWAVGRGCCGSPGRTGVDDVGFVGRVVTAISARLRIDHARVYVTGMSNGAMLTYRLACDTTIFAAAGPVAGTLLGPCPSPAPLSVIHIHGTADRSVPYDGSQGGGVARIDGEPVAELVETWRAVDGCGPATERAAGPITTSSAGCPSGRAVELITIAGAGHQWPGSTGASAPPEADPPAGSLDATATIWAFFAGHPKRPGA